MRIGDGLKGRKTFSLFKSAKERRNKMSQTKFDQTHSHFHPHIVFCTRLAFHSRWELEDVQRKEEKKEVKGGRGRRG